jgi:aminoglycoside 3-N-acetyltransferase
MITYHDWISALRELKIASHLPVLVHAAHEMIYESRAGVQTVLTALMATFDDIMVPAFTHRTQVIPIEGPENNGMQYLDDSESNRQAEIFSLEMSADTELGKLPTLLQNHPDATRSTHPVLSFVGIGVDSALNAQTIDEPLAPVRVIGDLNGWILLLGEDHRKNVAIHYAEYLVNRKQFIRWALTAEGVVECPNMPGCPNGFNGIASSVVGFCRQSNIGDYRLLAFPVGSLVQIACGILRLDPSRLLCADENCLCCNAVRKSIVAS